MKNLMTAMVMTVFFSILAAGLTLAAEQPKSSSEHYAQPIAQIGNSFQDEIVRLIPSQDFLQQKAAAYKEQWQKDNKKALIDGLETATVHFQNGQGTKARRLLDDCKKYATEANITLPDSFAEFRNVAQMKEALEDHASHVTGNQSTSGISYLSSALEEMQSSIAFENKKADKIKKEEEEMKK